MMHVILEQPPVGRGGPAGFAAATAAQDQFSGTTALCALPDKSDPIRWPERRLQPAGATVRARTVIRPSAGWRAINFAELFQYRELLWILAARDIKVRYKQTALGVLWAILQPLLTMMVFTVVFGR